MNFRAPKEDVDRIFNRITDFISPQHGKTDKNPCRVPSGIEYYRPLEGTPTVAEDTVRKRPDVDEVRLGIPKDQNMATKVIEAIYEARSYYEPVIYVQEILRNRSRGLDDSDTPHRWWNKSGDWVLNHPRMPRHLINN